jgi:Zn-dependent protease with chaperone function
VAILTPLLLPLAVSWPLFCDIECAWFAAGVDATRAGSRRRQYTVLRARHYLGLILVPVLALVAVDDGVKLIWPTLQGSAYSWLPLCIPLVLLLVLFPQVLRFVWGARPLADGPLRRRLMAAGRASSFVPREFLVWNTGRTIVNAAVAGFLPRLRYVFLSDGLVEKFDEVEVVAVFAHETGHIRCRHLATRGLVMLIPVAVWLGLCTVAPGAIGTANRTLADWGISSPTQLALAAPLGLALYSAVVVSWCSRLLEFEADLWACRSLAEQSNVASAMSTYTSVLEKLAATSGLGRRRSTWLHPSIVQRLEFLRRALTEPAVDRRFVFQLRLAKALATAGFAGIVASLVAVVVSGLTG